LWLGRYYYYYYFYYYFYFKSSDLSDTLQKHAAGALYKITKVQCDYQYNNMEMVKAD